MVSASFAPGTNSAEDNGMQGGNLSLQVHPLNQYIIDNFGMAYTQDESYYLLDAAPDACCEARR